MAVSFNHVRSCLLAGWILQLQPCAHTPCGYRRSVMLTEETLLSETCVEFQARASLRVPAAAGRFSYRSGELKSCAYAGADGNWLD